MIKFLFFLLLLPAMSFGLFDGIASFPWAIVVFPLLVKRSDLGRYVFLLSLLLMLSLGQLMFTEFNVLYYTKSCIALINATILLPVFLFYDRQIILKVVGVFKVYLVLTVLIGCLQLTVPAVREATSFLFGHASGFGTKGPPGLSYEPSRSALDMIYVFTTSIFVLKHVGKPMSRWLFYLVVVYLLIINRSISAFLFLSVYFLLWLFFGAKLKYRLIVLFVAPCICILLYNNIEFFDTHALNSLHKLMNSTNKKELIYSLAGHRLTGLLGSYESISLFGEGLGNWTGVMEDFVSNNISLIKNISHYRNVGNKVYAPLTFIGRFTLELGLFGMLLYFSLLLKNISLIKSIRIPLTSPELMTIFFSLVFLSYGSNPLPFVCIAVILNVIRRSTISERKIAHNRNEKINIYG